MLRTARRSGPHRSPMCNLQRYQMTVVTLPSASTSVARVFRLKSHFSRVRVALRCGLTPAPVATSYPCLKMGPTLPRVGRLVSFSCSGATRALPSGTSPPYQSQRLLPLSQLQFHETASTLLPRPPATVHTSTRSTYSTGPAMFHYGPTISPEHSPNRTMHPSGFPTMVVTSLPSGRAVLYCSSPEPTTRHSG